MRVSFGAFGLVAIMVMIVAGTAFDKPDLIWFAVIIMSIVGMMNLEK